MFNVFRFCGGVLGLGFHRWMSLPLHGLNLIVMDTWTVKNSKEENGKKGETAPICDSNTFTGLDVIHMYISDFFTSYIAVMI